MKQHHLVAWEPTVPSFFRGLGVMTPIYLGLKTFMFHEVGVQR